MIEYIFNYLPKIINTIGLLFDIIGVCFIWKFGLPENISRTGAITLILEQTDKNEIKKAKQYDFRSKIGLFLIIVGFALQLLSNFI